MDPPVKEGFVFDGWYLGESSFNFNDPVTSDITLTAHWMEELGSAPVVTAPVAKTLTYNGKEQALVNLGFVDGGVMHYSLGTASGPAGDTELPAATAAGTYYVWYAVEGDALHPDVEPQCVIATISKATISPKVSISGWTEGEKANAPVLGGANPGNGKVTFEYAMKTEVRNGRRWFVLSYKSRRL